MTKFNGSDSPNKANIKIGICWDITNGLDCDNRPFNTGIFHTYSRQEYQTTAHAFYTYYWAADRIYLEELVIYGSNQCGTGTDTTHNTYQGWKL